MDKKSEKNREKREKEVKEKKISRKEALKKSGYLAVSAATAMILLSKPDQAHAASPASPPAWGS